MKKIIAIVLMIALCVPVMFSCGKKAPGLAEFTEMYEASKPTKVAATVTQVFYDVDASNEYFTVATLNSSYEIVNGTVDGKNASVFASHIQSFRTVEDGGETVVVEGLTVMNHLKVESIEGVGSRTTESVDEGEANVGEWIDSSVWEIRQGKMAIELDSKLLEDVLLDGNTLQFIVPLENAGDVFGAELVTDMDSDVEVKITNDGAIITSIELHYYTKANPELNVRSSEMTVKVAYSYDLESIVIAD